MKIAITSDHRGVDLTKKINKHLLEKGIETVVFESKSATDNYTDQGKEPLKLVQSKECDFAILICGTGVGMGIIANRMKGIFAVHAREESEAYFARRHENANVLVLVAGYGDENYTVKLCSRKANRIVDAFLNTEFEGGRHQKRIEKIEKEY